MASWSVDSGDAALTIMADEGSYAVTIDITPAGKPFRADVETAEEVRLKLAAALGVAQGNDTP